MPPVPLLYSESENKFIGSSGVMTIRESDRSGSIHKKARESLKVVEAQQERFEGGQKKKKN